MSNKFEKKLEAFNKVFEELAKTEEPGFNAVVMTKRDDDSSVYSAFGDDELETVGMLFNAFVTKTKDLVDPEQLPDLVLTMIMVLDMEISDEFLKAVQNMAFKIRHTNIQ